MGSGGARFGAGRPAHRLKAEDSVALDVNFLSRNGYLVDGNWKRIYWRRQRKIRLEALIKAKRHHITIDIGGSTHLIHLTDTPSNFGGYRRWLVCPCCNKRMGVLYLRFQYFGCRHCQRISYQSQSGNSEDRLIWQYHKQFEKLFILKIYEGVKKDRALENFLVLAEKYEDIIEQLNMSVSKADNLITLQRHK